jgi:hypothetical protein
MTRAKHALSDVEGTQSTPSSETGKYFFFALLGVLARENFLKWFCQAFQTKESNLGYE